MHATLWYRCAHKVNLCNVCIRVFLSACDTVLYVQHESPYIKGVSHELDLAFVECLCTVLGPIIIVYQILYRKCPLPSVCTYVSVTVLFLRMCICTNHTFALFHQCPINISKYVKGKVMDIFWVSKHFNQYFMSMQWWSSRFFKSFSLPYIIVNFLIASLKVLTNVENAYWNPPQNSLLCDWSMFSTADLSLGAWKMRKNWLVTGGFRYDFTLSRADACNHFRC
jgi:hypothetical protein